MIMTVENIQTRIAECENVFLPAIRHDNEIARENINLILQNKEKFDAICSQIDSLETLVSRVKQDLQQLETQVDIATDELHIPEKTSSLNIFKSLNLFTRRPNLHATNLDNNGRYQTLDVFKAADFFDDAK